MKDEALADKINTLFLSSGLVFEQAHCGNYLTFNTTPHDIIHVLRMLKEDETLRFTVLTDLFAADFLNSEERFEIVYNLLSLQLNSRIIIKLRVGEGKHIPSAISVFNAACWYEREIFDLFGVVFEGTYDLRRILTDYDFEGHPLRKDFPVTGYVEVQYDAKLEKVVYNPVVMDQEFRNFDFLSPWGGTEYILPGDEKASDTAGNITKRN